MNKIIETLKQFEKGLDIEMLKIEQSIGESNQEIMESVEEYLTFDEGRSTFIEFVSKTLTDMKAEKVEDLTEEKLEEFNTLISDYKKFTEDEDLIELAMTEAEELAKLTTVEESDDDEDEESKEDEDDKTEDDD
jgi:hypothetical protein